MDITWTTIIGIAAGVCTTIAFLPQAIKALKTRQTKDLSLGMYWILAVGVFLWCVYGIVISDLPVILANSITFVFASAILILKIKSK